MVRIKFFFVWLGVSDFWFVGILFLCGKVSWILMGMMFLCGFKVDWIVKLVFIGLLL